MTVGLLSFAVQSSLKINLLFQANALAAPQSFRDAMQTAANMIEAACPNTPITVYLSVEYGTVQGVTLGSGQSASAGNSAAFITYTNLRTAISNNIRTSTMQSIYNTMGTGSSYDGITNWQLYGAGLKALGVIDRNTVQIDGYIGAATDIAAGNLVSVGLHEMRQAMGGHRGAGTIQDLSTFTSAGNVTTDGTATAYFSIDGGVTKLADWSGTSDRSDFLNGGAHEPSSDYDPFDAFYSGNTHQGLTALDIINLNSLGFQ